MVSKRKLAVLTDVGDVDVVVSCDEAPEGPELVLRPKYSRKPCRIRLSDLARRLLGIDGPPLEVGNTGAGGHGRTVPADDPGQLWLILPVPAGSRLETRAGMAGDRATTTWPPGGAGMGGPASPMEFPDFRRNGR